MKRFILSLLLTLIASKSTAGETWEMVEASNGTRYRVEVGSVRDQGEGWLTTMLYEDRGDDADYQRREYYFFNCKGYMHSSTGGGSIYLPPKSVGKQLETLVCKHRPKPDAPETPKASNYCVGFSTAACARMSKVIDSGVRPSYCKPGFALVGSGLNDEQLRICYATAP